MQNKFLKLIFLILILLLNSSKSFAQELEPTVDVNLDRINIDVRDRLTDFKQEVTNYLARTRFTNEEIINDVRGKPYKIKCNFQFFFTAATGFDSYEAQVFVGSSRNVFKTPNYTQLVRILDEKWDFNYLKGQSFYHDELKFNSLTSFLDYYAYLIIGFDDDSWELDLGTQRFQKCQDVVNLAVSSAPSSKGWAETGGLKASRLHYPQELLNSKYDDFRKGVWIYHFAGIDSLQWGKRQALERIAEAIKLFAKSKKTEIKSFTIKAFFGAKYQEIAQTLVDYY
ncbi:MAG: DUF4835 family protein, partial [Ignavibacteria bacterium]